MEWLNKATGTIEGAGLTWPGIACALCILIGIGAGFVRGFVKELVSLVIIFVTIGLVWFLNPYVTRFLKERTPVEAKITEQTNKLTGDLLSSGQSYQADEQEKIIRNMELPDYFSRLLLQNNNAEGYKALEVSSFAGYVSGFFADLILSGLSFFITYCIVSILLQVLVFVLDIFSRLPVVHGVNKLGGALLGGAKYVVYLWIFMLIATALICTGFGKGILGYIERDRFLRTLYAWNPLLRIFENIFRMT